MKAHRAILAGTTLLVTSLLCHAATQEGGYTGHGAETVSPEVLARYAPPPLPPELSRKIQSMMDIRAPGLGRVSPDGSRLFFGWSVTGSQQVWRLDGPDRFPVQLTGGEDRTTLVGISPDGKTLFVQRDRSGEENPGLYTLSSEGGPLKAVQHIKGVQTFFEFVSEDGKWLYYRSNDIQPDAYAIYRLDLATGAKESLVAEAGLWSIADHQPGGILLLAKSTGSFWAEYSLWDPVTRSLTPLLGQGEKQEYVVRYGAAPGQFLVLTPKLGEFRRLYSYLGGQFKPITPEIKWDVSGFEIDQARARVLYSVNEGGYTRLRAMDAGTFEPLALPPFADADHVISGTTTPDGRYTTIGIETAAAPMNSWVYDWKTGKLARWVIPSAPEVDTKDFAVASLEHYPARDGTMIPMFVRRPKACKQQPCPVVVEFHGGPESQATPGFSAVAQLYVEAGFVYVEPNVRGSDGYGKSWLDADDGPKRLGVLTDIEDCSKFVREKWAAGGKAPRVGVVGGSYGGYAALMAMTYFAGAYDAGCSVVGISNLLTFLNTTAPSRRILRTSEYGDPEKDREALLKLSATTHSDKLRAPLLIIQGAADPRVPAGEAIQMYEAARKNQVPSGLILFADEGHGASKRGNRVLMIGHEILWMQTHLQGEGPALESPEPTLKPSAPTPALLPFAPQSDARWEPMETFKKQVPPLAALFEKGTHANDLGESMPYRLFRPQVEPGKKYPLVLFLHGSSGSGSDNEKQLQQANMFGALAWVLPQNQEKHPCFVLAPQSEVNWPAVRLIPDHLPEILPGLGAGARQAVEILEELLAKEPIDRDRLYVTGHSMGGSGTWNLLSLRPDLFAAGVPVAGRANLADLPSAARVPVWVFHGEKDPVESVETARSLLATLQAAGGSPLYTLYPDVEHNSFLWAYTEPGLADWLFTQRRQNEGGIGARSK